VFRCDGMCVHRDGAGRWAAGLHPRAGEAEGRQWPAGQMVLVAIYRVRRARFASIVWDRDWLRCLGVTV
jgi:hypothetical protein